MKCLTIQEPWASAVYLGHKEIETRSWPTKYRGPLLIHAGASRDNLPYKRDGFPGPFSNNWGGKLAMDAMNLPLDYEFPLGCIICKVELYDCKPTEEIRNHQLTLGISPVEIKLGNYENGRYGFMLRDVHWLKEPIPFKGQLSIYDVPDALVEGKFA